MKIGVIGIGKLGICFSLLACKSELVTEVIGLDVNQSYVDSLNEGTFTSLEPSVNNLYKEFGHKLKATINKSDLYACDIVYIFVATPSTNDGSYDHSQILNSLKGFEFNKDIVIGCTVFPGFCKSLIDQGMVRQDKLYYSPLFIAQGNIVKGITDPDFVLIGSNNPDPTTCLAKKLMSNILSNPKDVNIVSLSLIEAELTKLSLNCFITTKIAYSNMVGDIVLKAGGDPQKVLDAVSLDTRVGSKCTKYGLVFGGPCFPRDNRALLRYASNLGLPAEISKASDICNEDHLNFMVSEAVAQNKEVVLDYLSYKDNSYLIDNSQPLEYAKRLKCLGVKINIKESRKEVLDQIKDTL